MYSKRGEVVLTVLLEACVYRLVLVLVCGVPRLLMSLDVSCMTTGTELAVGELIVMIYDRGC